MPVPSREVPPNFMLVGYRHNPYDPRHGRDLTIATNKACFDMVNFAYVTAAGFRSCRLQEVLGTSIIPIRSPLEAQRLALWKQPGFEPPSPDSTVDLFIGALPYGFCPCRVAQLLSDAAGVPIYFSEPIHNRDKKAARGDNAAVTKPTSCRVTVDARSVAAVRALSGTSIITGGGLLMAGPTIDDVGAFQHAVVHRDKLLHETRVAMSGGAATVSTRRALRTLVVELMNDRPAYTAHPQAPVPARQH